MQRTDKKNVVSFVFFLIENVVLLETGSIRLKRRITKKCINICTDECQLFLDDEISPQVWAPFWSIFFLFSSKKKNPER